MGEEDITSDRFNLAGAAGDVLNVGQKRGCLNSLDRLLFPVELLNRKVAIRVSSRALKTSIELRLS